MNELIVNGKLEVTTETTRAYSEDDIAERIRMCEEEIEMLAAQQQTADNELKEWKRRLKDIRSKK